MPNKRYLLDKETRKKIQDSEAKRTAEFLETCKNAGLVKDTIDKNYLAIYFSNTMDEFLEDLIEIFKVKL